jgi:hypothetical protein
MPQQEDGSSKNTNRDGIVDGNQHVQLLVSDRVSHVLFETSFKISDEGLQILLWTLHFQGI